MKRNTWKKLASKDIYDNPWIRLEEDQVINPGGGRSLYGKIHFKNQAIGIIPLDEEMNTWLVGQWRYPLDEYSWEIPMGGGPLGIDKLESAKRELKEETGITANDWELLLKMHTSNSVTDEVGYSFVAKGLTFGETEFEETEDLAIRKLPLHDAVEMCMRGEITDSLSMVSLLKLDRILRQDWI
jgi:8-oxo-dGTP pyrophosphatase MutT (NUDIX family)